MRRVLFPSLFALVGTAAMQAQSLAPIPGENARRLSESAALRLTAITPKFIAPPTPATDAAPNPVVEAPPRDLPRNQIPRLPAVVMEPFYVEEKRPPKFKDREIYTTKAKIDRMFLKHPGLHIGNLFGLNAGIAAMMVEEEERLERKREMEDMASLYRYQEPATAEKMAKEVQKTFMRPPSSGR